MMTTDKATNNPAAPPPGWRFRLGVTIFVTGLLTPLGVPLLALTDLSMGMKATLTGLLLAGIPEVFTLAAIALLGKEGFAYVKGRLMAVLRRQAPPAEVGRVRYYIGLAMLLLPAIYAWIIMYVPQYVPGYPEHRITIALILDALFFTSFFVLGGDFWDKFRALFVHKAKAQFPE